MNEPEWGVYAETKDGKVIVLARFLEKEEAEEYPITLCKWRRVWVGPVMAKRERRA